MNWRTDSDHRILVTPHIDIFHEPLWNSIARESTCEKDNQRLQAVHDALARLTPKQREAVELFYFEGLSQGQIARRLGVSQQVISKRLYGDRRGGRLVGGALAKLRAVLAPALGLTP